MYENYIDNLKSNNVEVLLDSIYELSAERGREPEGEIRKLLLKHTCHKDPEVRQIAVKTVAMHWPITEAFGIIKIKLEGQEEDEDVLETAVRSLGGFTRNSDVSKSDINLTLINVIRNHSLSNQLKKIAYIGLLIMHEEITVAQYAFMSMDMNSVTIDETRVNTWVIPLKNRGVEG